jgi:hypothetical protein
MRKRSIPYEVGYGKPPHDTRFRKGQSGNPKGRPKGSSNLASLLRRVMHEKIVITENGQRRTITKLEAVFKQLVNKAALGDPRAIHELLQAHALIVEPRGSADREATRPMTLAELIASIDRVTDPLDPPD